LPHRVDDGSVVVGLLLRGQLIIKQQGILLSDALLLLGLGDRGYELGAAARNWLLKKLVRHAAPANCFPFVATPMTATSEFLEFF
jgi:hypothetical protein